MLRLTFCAAQADPEHCAVIKMIKCYYSESNSTNTIVLLWELETAEINKNEVTGTEGLKPGLEQGIPSLNVSTLYPIQGNCLK